MSDGKTVSRGRLELNGPVLPGPGEACRLADVGPMRRELLGFVELDDYLEDFAIPNGPCCEDHNTHCEAPGDLCCGRCTEAAHDTFPIRHADGSACVLEARL